MKKLSSLLFLTIFLFLTSCSSENNLETDSEILNATSLRAPKNKPCDGYGLFVSTHGQQYDCGWKRGYEDWVYHYNSVAKSEGFDACSELRIGVEEKTNENFGTERTTVNTITRNVDNSPMIISRVIAEYQTYYNNLTAKRNTTSFNMGQFAGYNAGRWQVPYVADTEGADCNNGGSPGPYDWPEWPDEEEEEEEEQPIG